MTYASHAGRLGQLAKPVAIAMWDFSWLLRHYPGGEFADWDEALYDLTARGYDAVRIDAFPQLVCDDEHEEFCFHPATFGKVALWGSSFSQRLMPRAALVEFLGRCRAHGVRVGLSTWWQQLDAERQKPISGGDGLVDAWDRTVQFIDHHGLSDVLLYGDILNEYPRFNGYSWFREEMGRCASRPAKEATGAARDEDEEVHVWKPGGGPQSREQHALVRNFAAEVNGALQERWPELGWFASYSHGTDPHGFDLKAMGALDYHVWVAHCTEPDFAAVTRYFDRIHFMTDDLGFEDYLRDRNRLWAEQRAAILGWMEARIAETAELGRRHGIACGNTEGWGEINLLDHPFLDWQLVKEAGEFCVNAAVRHGYRFICTSNFTHPQFRGVWNDIAWHQRLTDRIRAGSTRPDEPNESFLGSEYRA